MENNITELVFILDESGSMSGLEEDVVNGFNSLIDKQRKIKGKCFLTAYTFSNDSRMIIDRKEINEVNKMDEDDYLPSGSTALLDALAKAINHIAHIHKYLRKEDLPKHTIFVITTDGLENASKLYNQKQIKEMVNKMIEVYHWEFIFLGANIDSFKVANDYGFMKSRVANYVSDKEGTLKNFDAISRVTASIRQNNFDKDWTNEVKKPK